MAPPEHRPSVRPPLTSTRLREIARDAYLVLAALASLALLINAVPGLHRTLSTVSPPDLVADYKVARFFADCEALTNAVRGSIAGSLPEDQRGS